MELTDIIFAKTSKEKPGLCEVCYSDGTSDIVGLGIGELFNRLNLISNRGRYFMIGRSALICENNIIMINPSNRKLVLAYDSLAKTHQVMDFSDNLLRELRREMSV